MKLTEYMAEYGDDLKEGYAELDNDDLDEFRDTITDNREERDKVIRDKPKARLKDIDSTFEAMKREVSLQYNL